MGWTRPCAQGDGGWAIRPQVVMRGGATAGSLPAAVVGRQPPHSGFISRKASTVELSCRSSLLGPAMTDTSRSRSFCCPRAIKCSAMMACMYCTYLYFRGGSYTPFAYTLQRGLSHPLDKHPSVRAVAPPVHKYWLCTCRCFCRLGDLDPNDIRAIVYSTYQGAAGRGKQPRKWFSRQSRTRARRALLNTRRAFNSQRSARDEYKSCVCETRHQGSVRTRCLRHFSSLIRGQPPDRGARRRFLRMKRVSSSVLSLESRVHPVFIQGSHMQCSAMTRAQRQWAALPPMVGDRGAP